MFKMIVHVTQSFDTVAQAQNFYNEIVLDLNKHKNIHINCQITKKFMGYSPESPKGHEVDP